VPGLAVAYNSFEQFRYMSHCAGRGLRWLSMTYRSRISVAAPLASPHTATVSSANQWQPRGRAGR